MELFLLFFFFYAYFLQFLDLKFFAIVDNYAYKKLRIPTVRAFQDTAIIFLLYEKFIEQENFLNKILFNLHLFKML